jgi:hypothetical protein
MNKKLFRLVLGVLAVFVAWSIIDIIVHGVILKDAYASTQNLWRPMEQMKMGLMRFVVLVSAACFVTIYASFIVEKNLKNAVLYGLVFGIGAGISMGYGSYAVMPMPYHMALTWFLGTIVHGLVGGLLAGLIVKR